MLSVRFKSALAAAASALLFSFAGCSHTATPAQPNAPVPSQANPANAPVFTEAEAGLNYQWQAPTHSPQNILDTIGHGCAFLDYNGDGCLDILLVGPTIALYQGDGKGHFKDVTAEAHLSALKGHYLGCAVGDFAADGHPGIFLYGYGCATLLRCRNGKFYEDVTALSGIKVPAWGSSASFADIDGDGRLDLFVGSYVQFDAHSPQSCPVNGVQTGCPPGTYSGAPGRLYRGLVDGKFQDVTEAWGLSHTAGKTLGAVFADYNGTGRQSLALANDEVPGELWLNRGASFENIGPRAGTAFSSVGQPHAGMGQDWGDYDGDGKLDLAVMTFSTELKPIFHNDGSDLFTDHSAQLGLADPMNPYVAFGFKWLDANNDGWLDMLVTNGHTSDNIEATGQKYTYREPSLLFQNIEGKQFVQIHAPGLDKRIVGRGLAIGDYDNDGKVDALIVDNEGKPILLHNETPAAGNWVQFALRGTKSNPDGYGAMITVTIDGRKLVRHCHADGSYMSSSDPRVHFGLSGGNSIDSVVIKWPDGQTDSYKNLPANKIYHVTEGGKCQ
jgi:enediyne biosynthesis protein E4